MNQDITIYTTAMCPVCAMVREFLTHMNMEYKEVNVDINPLAMLKLVAKTRRFSVPQTNINGVWVFGFAPEKIMAALK
ncbi:glutaredoxin family protein [Cytobacillus gottheilii]|uniref:glutaredoxin family protein n=1 Tax=Cytobacillus gottheilii TaxID=859144 RepID=UPI0009BC0D03|nr:glutaredoxin domain-containing protein [Cytobacillus gottheilii]